MTAAMVRNVFLLISCHVMMISWCACDVSLGRQSGGARGGDEDDQEAGKRR